MASQPKRHRAMGDEEWLSRLRRFAATGIWPSDAGNRPAPKQKKWHDLYHKIEKCPLQRRGQMSLLGGAQVCVCGFHTKKTPQEHTPAAAGPAPSAALGSATVAPSDAASPSSTRHAHVQPKLSLQMFVKPRFGGSQSAALKPNLSLARKPQPPSSTVTTSSDSLNLLSPSVPAPPSTLSAASASSPVSHHGSSPKSFIRTVSPFSLPPSPTPSVRASKRPATEIPLDSAGSDGLSSTAPLVPLPAPVVPLPAPVVPLPLPLPVVPSPGCGQLWLPEKLKKTLPVQDHHWIASTLWRNQRLRDDLKMWYDPPAPSLIFHQVPTPERFFCHRLLVWMPYHLWKIRVFCPKCGRHLTGGGIHKRARQVLDIDRNYLMITETLRCSNTECKASCLSSSNAVLDQLDLPHRSEFRIILTRKYACDIRVIRLMRERTLGNSSTRLAKQLTENHSEEWLQRLARYFGECADFANRPSLLPVVFQEPPEPVAVPTNRWLMAVYAKDIMTRIDHIKARITSVFGSVLKMDSTKKITRKLSGAAKGTALWLTSVGNELGQILISVLTAQEGPGLDTMVADLIERYSQAGMPPPKLLYVDTGCCMESGGETKLQKRFGGWPDLNIRLDIFHFMRRLAVGCTTDAHPLYPIFMARLSVCIFEWDPEDLAHLRRAKRVHLQQEGVPGITNAMVDKRITKEELALHCRRKTRGEETTIKLIDHLLQELMGEKGKDLMGVPLLDRVRMEHIWRVQKRHVKCIQDVPGMALYTETGTITTKEGLVLKNYRCARGSTSLESFHLHLNRFIPGTKANSLNFQLFLLEGLNRWNQDRAVQSLATKPSTLLSYSGDLVQSVNSNSLKVLGRKYVPAFHPPPKYTGELIGIEYLFKQTGQPMQDMNPDAEETDELLEEVNIEEEQEDEGFEEGALDPTIENLMTTESVPGQPATSSTQPVATFVTSEPVALAASAQPSAITATFQPSAPAAATSQPAAPAASAPAQPAAVAATSQPVTTAASTQPFNVAASTQPAAITASTQPPVVAASTQPAAITASTQPAAIAATFQPSAPAAATSQPVTPAASTQPVTVAASTQPVNVAAFTQPAGITASTQPTAITASTQPTAIAASTQPAAIIASTQPAAIAASTQPPVVAASTQPTALSIEPAGASPEAAQGQLAVDEHNIPGMNHVDNLAEYLVSLRNQTSMTLNNQQVSTLIGLWQNLLPYDQQQVVFAARHQDRLTVGRFRSPKKKAEFTSGVDSVKRCALGSTASVAQWPDCCRLVEAIFVRLCLLHKSPKKHGKGTVSRWTLILEDYRNIRQLILGNGAIMESTTLQLVDLNQTTLIQWHNKRVKRQDSSLLLQGINLPGRLPVSSGALPPANVRPAAPPQTPGPEHMYNLPSSTIGQAKSNWRAKAPVTAATPQAIQPKPAAQKQLFPRPPASSGPLFFIPHPPSVSSPTPATFTVVAVPTPACRAPQNTIAPLAPSAPPPPPASGRPASKARFNKRKVVSNTCRKCGQYRTAETGHSQYQGTIYCPNTETVPKEIWLEQIKKSKM